MVVNPRAPELKQVFTSLPAEGRADIAECLREMGYELQDLYYRNVGRHRLQTIIDTGTDRIATSELYTDDNADFESINRYEELAMYTHGIEDRRFTTYLHDGAETRGDATRVAQGAGGQVILFYPKSEDIIPVKARDYNPQCVPQSGGFALFKDEPSKLLLGVAMGNKFYTLDQLRENTAAPIPVQGF